MKRDKELIKKILLNVEKDEPEATIEGYDEQNILNHKDLLVTEELILGKTYFDTENERPRVSAVLIHGLTSNGHDYIESNGKKEDIKTKITNNTINILGNNEGIVSAGNKNTNTINMKFEDKFTQLIQSIQRTDVQNKNQIIQELNEHKEDKPALQKYLGTLLTRGAEVATLVPVISSLLEFL